MTKDEEWLLEEKYGGEKTAGFFTDCERLKAGEPLGYVIGYVPFLNCKIWLDSRPLIPRPETEFWVEKAIASIREAGKAKPRQLHVLDLCAGSGCIGVAIAKALPKALVDFGEIDQAHYSTIDRTIVTNGIEPDRCRIFVSDLFAKIPEKNQYDFILSNPPYIDPVLNRTEKSVKNFEPHQALYGGEAGLEIIEKIIAEAPQYLHPHGQLWLEHEPEQSLAIQSLATTQGFIAATHTDQYKVERYSILVLQ